MNAKACGLETILVFDDDEMLREIPVIVLSDAGYTVFEAGGSDAAFDCLQHHRIEDLLFTDIALPGDTNGICIAQKALLSNPQLKILFTTGYRDPRGTGGDQSTLGQPVIYKPYKIEVLVKTVRAVLDGSMTCEQVYYS